MAKKEDESVGSSGYCPYTKGLSSPTPLCYQKKLIIIIIIIIIIIKETTKSNVFFPSVV